jgi:uncharacterized protein (TIGR02757 family)
MPDQKQPVKLPPDRILALEKLYRNYNRRKWVYPDPLIFLYSFPDIKDREIVAFISSCLAYGNVSIILKNIQSILEKISPSPCYFLLNSDQARLHRSFSDFKHRFATGKALAQLLSGLKKIVEENGSLGRCFVNCLEPEEETLVPALNRFVKKIHAASFNKPDHLLPLPERGSACKRLCLFLRWMVRKDEVDPGGWDHIPASRLIIPVDTHILRISRYLNLTFRKAADMKTALEITSGFKQISPEDPVKYDFVISRLGIRNDMPSPEQLFG